MEYGKSRAITKVQVVENVMNCQDEEVVTHGETVIGKRDSVKLHDLEYYTIGSDQEMDEQEDECLECW